MQKQEDKEAAVVVDRAPEEREFERQTHDAFQTSVRLVEETARRLVELFEMLGEVLDRADLATAAALSSQIDAENDRRERAFSQLLRFGQARLLNLQLLNCAGDGLPVH